MKIVMFSDTYGSVTTTFIRNEVEFFRRKFDLVYLAQRLIGKAGSVRTHCIPYRENLITKKLNWYFWKLDLRCSFKNGNYADSLNNFLKAERPDVIHCHFAYEALKLLQNISPEFKVPVFVHFHGYDATEMLRKRSYVRALQECFGRENIFPLVVSDKMKSDLKKAGIPMDRAELIRYGIDLNFFKEAGNYEKGDETVFLQISSLSEKKGHEFTLRAFSVFFSKDPSRKKNVKIVFAGDGSRKRELMKLSQDLGLTGNVSFIGNITSAEAIPLLERSNVFVHHSITASNGDQKGIPNAIIEAMAMRLPVLSTFHAGIPELVEDGVNGLLCKEKDIETFARQIEEIISWNKLDINRAVVEDRYNMEKHNQQLELLYKQKMKLLR